MKQLNIWYVSAYDAPKGQSSRTYDYAKELTSMGHRVTIITSSYNHFTHEEKLSKKEIWREEWYGKIRCIWLKTFPYKNNGWRRGVNMLSNAWRAYQIGKNLNDRPDIIFGPSVPLFTGLSACFLAKNKKSNFIFEVRDIWPQALIDLGLLKERSFVAFLFRKVETYLYRKARKIIVVLPFAHKHICKYNIPKKDITWIPNGVNLRRFEGLGPYDGGGGKLFTVMYIGGFSTTHGIEIIIEAAKYFDQKENSNIRFVLVGAGKGLSQQVELVDSYNLSNIEFRGYIPKAEIARTQIEADILVASVKDTPVYQFGINSNKIFDYLAAGRPIIFAGNTPNNPIKEASAGISIPPEDSKALIGAIEQIVEMSPKERIALGANGRSHAEEFYDTKILAKKLETELQSIFIHQTNE